MLHWECTKTAEKIWENGEYKRDLPDNADELQSNLEEARKNGLSMFLDKKNDDGFYKSNPEYDKYTTHLISGIYGSGWATPVIQLCFKNGTEKMIECHNGGEITMSRPIGLLGELSAPVQEQITPISS